MRIWVKKEQQMQSVVSIVKSTYSTAFGNLSRAISLSGPLDMGGKDKIIVKINLCDARTPDTGATTHPLFLDAVLKYLRENFKDTEIFVVESDGSVVIADYYVKWFGLLRVIQKWNAKWRNLSNEKCIMKEIPGWKYGKLPSPKIFENSFFITLPKLKTNALTKITCCIKNQRGCNPMLNKQQFHPVLDEAIVAENLAVGIPSYCIVDGIIGMGGIWGPGFGIPIHSNLIVTGKDEVAVDCVCSRIMGFNPKRIGHIRRSIKYGLGNSDYRVLGERIIDVKQDFKWRVFDAFLFRLAQRIQEREFRRMREDA